MTTPEPSVAPQSGLPARTAEQARRDAIHRDVSDGHHIADTIDNAIRRAAIHYGLPCQKCGEPCFGDVGIGKAVCMRPRCGGSCLPEPQASKASEGDILRWIQMELDDRHGEVDSELAARDIEPPDILTSVAKRIAAFRNLVKRAESQAALSSAPAGEAVSVAREVARDWLHAYMMSDSESVKYADARRAMANAVRTALSAPPPSTGDKPKCPTCGCVNTWQAVEGDPPGMTNYCPESMGGCGAFFTPAPTPPPAPASKGETVDAAMFVRRWMEKADDGVLISATEELSGLLAATSEAARLRAAPLSVAPAREGFTYPDSKVDAVLTRIDALGRMSGDISNPLVQPIVRSLVDATDALSAARVTLPQQGGDAGGGD
jgi:hypothetical protein